MKANHCNVQCSYDPRDGHLCYSCDDCGLLSGNYRGAFTKGRHKCIENVDEQKHNDFLPQKLTDDNVGLTKKHTNSGGRITLHKLVNARRRGIMVSRIEMMHEVVYIN